MNRYCLVLVDDRCIALTVQGHTWDEALEKVYRSYSYKSKVELSPEDYRNVISTKTSEEGIKLLEDLLDTKVQFFGVINGVFKDGLYELK